MTQKGILRESRKWISDRSTTLYTELAIEEAHGAATGLLDPPAHPERVRQRGSGTEALLQEPKTMAGPGHLLAALERRPRIGGEPPVHEPHSRGSGG